MASSQVMMRRAREAKRNSKSNTTPLFESKNGTVKLYSVKSLDRFKEITGRLPYEFEMMEYLGLQLSDRALSNMFDTDVDTYTELYVGSWKDLIVELNDRNGDGKKEYFAIRLGSEDAVVSRPAYRDTLTLTGLEAAFARFACSTNHISWYATVPENKGVVRTGPFSYIKGQDAANYYDMAMWAAGELNMGNVYRFLD